MVDALTKCFSKRREVREAVTVRKEPLVLGYGGLSLKNPLVLMHPLLTEKNQQNRYKPESSRSGTGLTVASSRPEEGFVFPSSQRCCMLLQGAACVLVVGWGAPWHSRRGYVLGSDTG